MIDTIDITDVTQWPPPPDILPLQGGMRFREAAPMLCGVVDNGVCEDDPRVMVRLNEATKMVLDTMIPVGGVAICYINTVARKIILPPSMENIIEAHPFERDTSQFGSKDITESWYQMVNNSTYVEPEQSMDIPLIDLGLNANPVDPDDVRRIYLYPGLEPPNSIVQVTGAKRYLPITNDDDFLIVQNIEALKLLILSIERNENNAPDDAQKYRQMGMELLQKEVQKHQMDPRNFAFRKSQYMDDTRTFAVNTMGWMRAQIALDIPSALKIGKRDLTWTINQAERRLMERAMYKDTLVTITAEVVGGYIYMPQNVEAVLAIDLDGQPIPIRSQFFQYLENGPGFCPAHAMLVDQGDFKQPGFSAPRRKYKLNACCNEGSCISAVCKLRWLPKEPGDMMVIKNYEALRLMVTSKFLEEKEDWKNVQANQQLAFDILDKELRNYLSGIRHTVHVQTLGFGLGDVGGYMTH
jgi:hypothetical protein